MDIVERFWSRVDRTDDENDCWLWKGGRSGDRYGYFFIHPRNQLAHRVAWTFTNGVIPAGMNVCHKCDHVLCVNPKHLFLGTQQDNVHDMHSKGRARKVCGEAHTKTRLTEVQVREIFALYSEGIPIQSLIDRFPTTKGTIDNILGGKTWKHLGLAVNRERHKELKGERASNAKLAEEQVREAFRLYNAGALMKDIAAKFGVHKVCIQAIFSGKSWTHLGLTVQKRPWRHANFNRDNP